MIRVEALTFTYGRDPVLQDIDVEVPRNQLLGVVGPNGCGKSTLLRLMRGVLSPTRGNVLLDGHPVDRMRRKEVARRIAVVPQTLPAPFPYPVQEVVAMGRYPHAPGLGGFRALPRRDRQEVDRALALTDTLHLADRRVTELSGGELQRVILARALAQETPILLLDEATSQLDLDHRLEVAGLMLRLNREKGTTMVQVSHDVDLVAEVSHRLLLLDEAGKAVALGPPDTVVTAENLRRVFGVEVLVEQNPFTGSPRVVPVVRDGSRRQISVRVHVVCGGGSGAEILRRLHLMGCPLTAGPLNRGDSDEALARALGIEAAEEEPFCPLSAGALARARSLAAESDVLVVAPTAWGPGNLGCLDLARAILEEGTAVYLMDPRAERDFSGGEAWKKINGLMHSGARIVSDLEALLHELEPGTG